MTMKKLSFLLLACVISLCACNSRAGNDRLIQVNQLPATAQQLIKKHFPNRTVSVVKEDKDLTSKDYEVIFANGDKIDFDNKGNWDNIDCKSTAVPDALVPAPILKYVRANYPAVSIISIDKDRRDIEIELSNRMDLKFDLKYNLIDIDN